MLNLKNETGVPTRQLRFKQLAYWRPLKKVPDEILKGSIKRRGYTSDPSVVRAVGEELLFREISKPDKGFYELAVQIGFVRALGYRDV